MALNKAQLTAAIQAAFEDAKENEWEAPQVAAALADAIDAYVRGADVRGVRCSVPVSLTTTSVSGHTHGVNGTLTATQDNDGELA